MRHEGHGPSDRHRHHSHRGTRILPDPNAPKFSSEQERAQKAIEEFQKVAAKYGDPYRTEARYFIATNCW